MRKAEYKPQYSLSIFYLKQILGKKEYSELLKKYIEAKKKNWPTGKNKGITRRLK